MISPKVDKIEQTQRQRIKFLMFLMFLTVVLGIALIGFLAGVMLVEAKTALPDNDEVVTVPAPAPEAPAPVSTYGTPSGIGCCYTEPMGWESMEGVTIVDCPFGFFGKCMDITATAYYKAYMKATAEQMVENGWIVKFPEFKKWL